MLAELVAECITLIGLRRGKRSIRSPSTQLLTACTSLLQTRSGDISNDIHKDSSSGKNTC